MSGIAVFGIGYVGCVTAACLGCDGHRVVGVDVDPAKVAELNDGLSPISEPGLDVLIAEQVLRGRLNATTDVVDAVRRSEIALITVGTPSAERCASSDEGECRAMRCDPSRSESPFQG